MLLFALNDSSISFLSELMQYFQGFVWCGCEFKDLDFFVIVAY